MRPNAEELLRGLQGSLLTYVLPEVGTPYARTELMIAHTLLGIAASEWDGAAQRLVDDNAALRALARRATRALAGRAGATALVDELRALAAGTDPSVRLSELNAANERLRAALGRFGALAQHEQTAALRKLRAALIERLREEAESRALSLMGPRADG